MQESLRPLVFSFRIKGIKPKVLSSRPTQHIIKDEDEATKSNLDPIIKEKRRRAGENQIREEIESIVGA
jgi:hypothetical protein